MRWIFASCLECMTVHILQYETHHHARDALMSSVCKEDVYNQLRPLCRLFLLDMLLGNPDRMPCEALGWRGNPHNIMYCRGGAHAGRMVAIDSAVQRRPPGTALAGFPYCSALSGVIFICPCFCNHL